MGNFTNIIIIVASIGLCAGLLVIASQDIAQVSGVPYQSQFFGDYVFSQYDLSTQYVHGNQTSTTDWGVDKTSTSESELPSQSTTGASSSGFQFPDWLQSGYKWITGTFTSIVDGVSTPVKMFLNVVGIPYTIIKGLSPDNRVLAVVSGYFSTIFSIVLIMFLLGREN